MTTITQPIAPVLPTPKHAKTRRAIPWQKVWWIPLAVILAVQTVLTLRLFTYAASSDEGRYIYAGHQLIFELWHGSGSPYYETYFSGAPDIYSVMAAMADHVGGLTAVRMVSLIFMLIATSLLFTSTRHLFGYGAGYAAAGLFASLSLVHSLGAYANYDALALMLLAGAAYSAIRAGDSNSRSSWLVLVPIGLLAANMSKYATVVFDPVVIALAAARMTNLGAMVRRALTLAAATILTLGIAIYLAGGAYTQGVLFTTIARRPGASVLLGAVNTTPRAIVHEAVSWIGIIIALSCLALLFSIVIRRKAPARWQLLLVLLGAGLLVPVEALRLHSDESMNQHVSFGAWFAAIAAGYALAAMANIQPIRMFKYVVTAGIVGIVAVSGIHYASAPRLIAITSHSSDRSELSFISSVSTYLSLNPQTHHYLIDGAFAEMTYDLSAMHVNVPWFAQADDNYFKYPIPGRGGDSEGRGSGRVCLSGKPGCVYLEGPAAYRAAIKAHYFSFITLFGRSPYAQQSKELQDWVIIPAVEHTPGYVLITMRGGAPTWIYAPAYHVGANHDH